MEKIQKEIMRIPLFAGLRSKDFEAIARDLRPRRYPKNEIIFHYSDDSHTLYILTKGIVRIFRDTEHGRQTSFGVISAPDIFGELSVLDGLPRSCSVKALQNCSILEMRRKPFLRHLKEIPGLSLQLIKLLAGKVRLTTEYAETICQYDAAGCLMKTILYDLPKHNEELESGKIYTIDIGMNQSELASLVGAGREWVNKILRQWEDQKIIKFRRGQITILDIRAAKEELKKRIGTCVDDEI